MRRKVLSLTSFLLIVGYCVVLVLSTAVGPSRQNLAELFRKALPKIQVRFHAQDIMPSAAAFLCVLGHPLLSF